MSDINKQMAEFAKELWENYIKPKVGIEFSDTVSYYMATVVSNDGYNRVTIKRPFDDAYQVSCLDDMAGLEAGDTVLVLRFGSGTNNANHIVFGKGNGNMNYTAAAATATATEASVAAGQAAEAAAEAIESAEQAASAAESAQQSALEAQESAETANQAANNALIGLATVEGVVDTVNWFAEHKTASTDTSVVPSKTYYEYNPVAGTLSAVTPEGDENPSEEGWYELSEAISNYVASHVATTNDGLYVVGLSNGWKILVSSGTGTYTPGIFLIDPSGNIAQATTANGITFDDSKPFYIGDDNASIVFDGNGHISISGIGVSIGSTGSKSIDEVLSELGASIKTIEYGVGNSATSHSDITSWSSNTPEWQEDKYIWQRTTTNGLTYTYTCIQGAAGAPGAPGVSVSDVTNYYLATSQSSGVTRETTGWTTSIQTMTSTNQYLWNYEVVTGSDGSTLNTTDPIIIGRYGQDGGSGRGITGITEYYLASDQQTGITPSSSGWTTTVQTTTTATPYLWNYEVITYSSGSPETSSARIIGTHGATGADGRMLYATSTTAAGTAAKTATLANGTLTLTAGATVAVTFTNANTVANPTLNVGGTGAKTIRAGGASLTATSEYNWTAGATAIFVYDGTYWQMDGTAALDKLGSLEIGGRNLLIAYDALPVADRLINSATGYTYDPDTGTYVITQTGNSSTYIQIYTLDGVTDASQIAGKEVTFSVRSITSSRAAADSRLYLHITKSGGGTSDYRLDKSTLKRTLTLPSDTEKIGYVIRLDQNCEGSTGETATFVGVKCELGNMATDWTPAPEDIQADIANVTVGGRNLSTGTGTATGFTPVSGRTYFSPLGFYPVGDYGVSLIRGATTEDEWVVSFDYAVTGAATATELFVSMNRTVTSYMAVSPNRIAVPTGNSSGHFSTVFQLTSEQIAYGDKWLLSKTNGTDNTVSVTLSNFMFEKGNRASSWSPAPEDVAEAIASVEDTATEALNKHGFCSCSTAAGTKAKTASLTGFQLKTGSTVHVTFANANTIAGATLNINSTGAKTIKWNNGNVEADKSPWAAGECVTFVYDGAYWVVAGQSNILADNIVAGSIAADRIKANVISAVNGGSGKINADKIYTEQITIGESQVTGLTASLAGKESTVTTATPTYDIDQGAYFSQQSNKAIMGQESLDYIIGGSIGWNQLVSNTGSTNSSSNVTATNNNDGTWTFNGNYTYTSQNTFFNINYTSTSQNSLVPVIKGHKYLTFGNYADVGIAILFILSNYSTDSALNDSIQYPFYAPVIFEYTGSNSVRLLWRYQLRTTKNYSNLKAWVECIDLTLIFGSTIADYAYSLEQATSGAGIAWLAKYLNLSALYAYNAGEIRSVGGLNSHDTVGFNQWDGTYTSGQFISAVNGTATGSNASYGYTDYISVIGGQAYYLNMYSIGSSAYGAAWYDRNKTFISGVAFTQGSTAKVGIITAPSGAVYMRTSIKLSDIGSTCINISKTTGSPKNGDYRPYVKHSYPLNSSVVIRGVPKLINNKLSYDGDVYYPDGMISRRYGIYDLGSASWTLAYGAFRTGSLRGVIKPVSQTSIMGNAICTKYATATWDAGGDKTILIGLGTNENTSIAVIDANYSDAATFKTAMSGVYLVYEKITVTTETATPYQQVQMADPDGTEEFVTTSVVPVGHYTRYPTNLKAAIDTLPVDTTDAARTATNYITNISSGGGITVTGNGATGKVHITQKVRVQADSTHFTDVESTGMKVYSGSSSVPVAQFLATGSKVSYDATHYTEFAANSWTICGGTNSPTITASTYPNTATEATTGMAGLTISNSARTKKLIQLFTYKRTYTGSSAESANITLHAYDTGNEVIGLKTLRLEDGSTAGGGISIQGLGTTNTAVDMMASLGNLNGTQRAGGLLRVHYGTASVSVAAQLRTFGQNSGPSLEFYNTSGTLQSWYGANLAYIYREAGYAGYAAHGKSNAHKYTFEWSTIGSYNYLCFYVDTSEVYRLQQQSYSDRRVKKDIEPIQCDYKDAVGAVDITQFRYDFNSDVLKGADGIMFGVIAQDLIEELDDKGISYTDTPLVSDMGEDEESLYSVNYTQFLLARIAHDEDRIQKLEEQNKALEERLSVLEDIMLKNLIRDIDET